MDFTYNINTYGRTSMTQTMKGKEKQFEFECNLLGLLNFSEILLKGKEV